MAGKKVTRLPINSNKLILILSKHGVSIDDWSLKMDRSKNTICKYLKAEEIPYDWVTWIQRHYAVHFRAYSK
jgi:hypothetical protein